MTKREQMADLSEHIERLETIAKNAHNKVFELVEERNKLIGELVLEGDMLANTEWKLEDNDNGRYWLEFAHEVDHPSIAELTKLTRTNWHCNFALTEGVSLYYDDSRVTIQFDDTSLITPTAQKMKLILNGSAITTKLHKLKREVKSLEALCHSFGV